MPWPKDKSFPFSAVAACIFKNEPDGAEELHHFCYPVLKHLSIIGISNIPDLMQYLPAPQSKAFPEQALGLQLLINQGPRFLLDGIDQRYTNAYFDVISLRYTKQLHALPEVLRLDSKTRWMDEVRANFDCWVVARFWFMAPFALAEDVHCRDVQSAMAEESRLAVEELIGKIDPYRATKEALEKDVYAFSKEYKNFPRHPDVKLEEFVFWFLMILDAHPPIIKTFERYPYRNGAMGREITPRELEWLEKTDHFGEVEPEVAKRIREGVLAG